MVIRLLTIAITLLCYCNISFAEDKALLIGIGDTLSISVYNERDLSVQVKVEPSGYISVPLLGQVLAVNKTTKVLGHELESAFLDGYLVNPRVSVVVTSFPPFYIKGAVKSPGSYEFVPGLTIDQAIAIAGGLKDRASKDHWYILRGIKRTKLKAKKNSKVVSGDIITIEESIF